MGQTYFLLLDQWLDSGVQRDRFTRFFDLADDNMLR